MFLGATDLLGHTLPHISVAGKLLGSSLQCIASLNNARTFDNFPMNRMRTFASMGLIEYHCTLHIKHDSELSIWRWRNSCDRLAPVQHSRLCNSSTLGTKCLRALAYAFAMQIMLVASNGLDC
jgi:hypothetical protein